MLAANCSTASEHSRRPSASVVGAGGAVAVGLGVVGTGFAGVVRAGLVTAGLVTAGLVTAGLVAVVTAGLAGVGVALRAVGLALVVDVALVRAGVAGVTPTGFVGAVARVLVAEVLVAGLPVVAGAAATAPLPAVAVVVAAVDAVAPDEPVPAGLLDGAGGADVRALEDKVAAEAGALEPVSVSREANTPVNVGAAEPLTAAVPVAPLGVPPFDRPATTKITPTSTAIRTTMKITRRSQ